MNIRAVICGVCSNPTGEGYMYEMPTNPRCPHCEGLKPITDEDQREMGEPRADEEPTCPSCGSFAFQLLTTYEVDRSEIADTNDPNHWDEDAQRLLFYENQERPDVLSYEVVCSSCGSPNTNIEWTSD